MAGRPAVPLVLFLLLAGLPAPAVAGLGALAAPDLLATSLATTPSPVLAGDSVTFRATVRNSGDAAAGSFVVRFVLDGNDHSNHTVAGLSPSQTTTLTSPAWNATAGNHTLDVLVDVLGQVAEGNETNNARTVSFAADDCATKHLHAWFISIVYDSAFREDFILDVFNFEGYLKKLRESYCITTPQSSVMAFNGSFTHNGKTYSGYPAATETRLKSKVAEFGANASQHDDSVLFLFLSSHGSSDFLFSCPGGARGLGSVAFVRSDGLNNGALYDCELGAALNSALDPDVRLVSFVDCSFCGGFSDSLTALSGTVPDDALPRPSGMLGPNRIVMTGCAITTECFGGPDGGRSYGHLTAILDGGLAACDGWTAPAFPVFQGADVPVKDPLLNPPDGVCTMSEWFFAAVDHAYDDLDYISIQQQYRIKYGPATLAGDTPIM